MTVGTRITGYVSQTECFPDLICHQRTNLRFSFPTLSYVRIRYYYTYEATHLIYGRICCHDNVLVPGKLREFIIERDGVATTVGGFLGQLVHLYREL